MKLNRLELLKIHSKYVKEGREKKIIKPHEHVTTKAKLSESGSKQINIEEEKLKDSSLVVNQKPDSKNNEFNEAQNHKNPFKTFFNNIGDRSRELANSVMKEKDDFMSKLNNSKSPTSIQENNASFESCKDANTKETQTDFNSVKEDYSANLK